MLFGKNWLDQTIDEYFGVINGVAEDPATLIFLDTNILAYLFKLHSGARSEFFQWLDSVVALERLAIPAWAANEYLSRVTSKTLSEFTPKSKEPSQILKALEAMHETATLFVDEPLLRKIGITTDRVTYLADFKSAIDSLRRQTRVFAEQFEPGSIHEEIVEHLGDAILESDLIELSNRAAQNGAARYANRLPPGYLDGGKENNLFGDLIIWYEILSKSAASVSIFPKVLLITNDEKADWVYAPKMRTQIIRGSRKSVGNNNPEIKIADPRLVSEFGQVTGHHQITICSLSALIEALSKVNASRFAQLAAAIQINTGESVITSAPAAEDAISEDSELELNDASGNVVVSEPEVILEISENEGVPIIDSPVLDNTVNEPGLVYDVEALQDSQYQFDAPLDINEVIRALKSHNWYTQNPAVDKIRFLDGGQFTPSSWFVLGRNLYQAACGNSQKAMEFMSSLDSRLLQFSDDISQHILAGMLFEVYFNSNGEFRSALKFTYADRPLALVVTAKYLKVKEFMRLQLRNHEAQLKFLPGDHESKVFEITSTPHDSDVGSAKRTLHILESVVIDGVELLRPLTPTGDVWGGISGGTILTLQNIRDKFAEELAIPRWAFTTRFIPAVPGDVRFLVTDDKVLYPKWALLNGR